jgi:hypothetical protein
MINCKFCQKPCRKIGSATHQCDYHGGTVVKYVLNEFRVNYDVDTYNTILVFSYNDKTYHASFLYDNNTPVKFRVDRVLLKRYRIAGIEPVFTLDFHPNITPDNVQKKMQTYIMMS